MTTKNCFKAIFFLLIFMIYTNNIFSNYICPPDSGSNCSNWQQSTYVTSTEHPDCNLTVLYRFRECDGVYQIYIDDVISSGNCSTLNQEPGSTFLDWLNVVLIEEVVNLSNQPFPPDCPATTQKAIFYSASCWIWVDCEFEVDSTTRRCDIDWRGDYPNYESRGVQKVKISKLQSCGYTCCKSTYTICNSGTGTNGQYNIHIQALSKESIGTCSNPDGFVKPCIGGCE